MYGSNKNNKGKVEKNKKIKEGPCIFPFMYKWKSHDNMCFQHLKEIFVLQKYHNLDAL